MSFEELIFILILSVLFALLEIQIEGKDGWADKLPTWKVKNPLKKITGLPHFTGYHIYFWAFIFTLLHFPYFLELSFNFLNESKIIETFILILLSEDFLWFLLNPNWGIKKFLKEEIPWHNSKLFYLPKMYWIAFIAILFVEVIKKFI